MKRELEGVVGIVAFVIGVIVAVGIGYSCYLEQSSILLGISVAILVFFMWCFIVGMMLMG